MGIYAYALGFEYPSYFNSFFKKNLGVFQSVSDGQPGVSISNKIPTH